MQKFSILVLVLGILEFSLCEMDYDFEFERIEPIKGEEETIVDYSGVIFTKRGRNEKYIANGNFVLKDDLGEDVTHSIKTLYSPSGSSQFRAHPYTVQKSSACEFFKTFYREYGQPWMLGHTGFPVINEEGLCPIPKGDFFVKDLIFDEEQLPNHAPRGIWKAEQIFERNGKVIGGLRIYGKVTDKV